jgi:indoleamine 2,3-dioxygenase
MQRPPIVHYASMMLHNWTRLDRDQPVSADNARMQVQFLGGVDEDWFFIGSLGVELAGAPLIPVLHGAATSSHSLGDEQLADLLAKIAAGIVPVTTALDRMIDWCDPHAFYLRVRPYLSGWPAPGVVYQGVSDKPQIHVGGSAGQSSLIQSIDAVLGVDHKASGAGAYLAKLRAYMPVPHKAFVEDLSAVSTLRDRVAGGSSLLRSAYNEAIAQLDTFRQHHIALAQRYIAIPSGEAKGELGTGGTDFREFLGSARAGTARSAV